MKFAVIGSGFSGAIIANTLAKLGHLVDVYEKRSHVGGNCYTERDQKTGIMLHVYGPHIFHTNDEEVWTFVNSLENFVPYTNRVKTTVSGRVYSMPINLHTINQFYETCMKPQEAEEFIESKADKIAEPKNFEEQAIKFVGRELYDAFFKGYTKKQWGLDPKTLPASILKRLPLRFNYDDNYYNHKYQGMPINGYTPIFEKLLSHEKISVKLDTKFKKKHLSDYVHVFTSGPIDEWFDYEFGRLPYRTLDFIPEWDDGDFQGCAVMNYGDESVPYTRISEHKHFSPWESHEKTIVYKEISRECKSGDIEYYPIRLVEEMDVLKKYLAKAAHTQNVSFLGRLGTYRYLDMDVTIREALDAAKTIEEHLATGDTIPAFFVKVD